MSLVRDSERWIFLSRGGSSGTDQRAEAASSRPRRRQSRGGEDAVIDLLEKKRDSAGAREHNQFCHFMSVYFTIFKKHVSNIKPL